MAQNTEYPPGNLILAALPSHEFKGFSEQLESVELKLGEILHMPEEQIEYVYFPIDGVISLVAILQDGETVEAGIVGREGMVGIPVVLGVDTTTNQALVQGGGKALRMKANSLKAYLRNDGALRPLLLRYVHEMFAQVYQTTACNRVHTLNE